MQKRSLGGTALCWTCAFVFFYYSGLIGRSFTVDEALYWRQVQGGFCAKKHQIWSTLGRSYGRYLFVRMVLRASRLKSFRIACILRDSALVRVSRGYH